MEQVSYGPTTCTYGPLHMYNMIFSGQLQKSPLHVLKSPHYMPARDIYDMVRVHCRNLVTVYVKCFHVLYDSYGPPLPSMKQVSYGPSTCTYGPLDMYNIFFQASFERVHCMS